MRLASGYEDRRARVELLPMIDVVFLLLVFFIYAMLSMVVHRGMKVQLPAGVTTQVDDQRFNAVTITVDNEILVDGRTVTVDTVAASIEKGKPVYIGGDKHADLGVALRVLDKLRAAEINQVMFEMEREAP